MPLGDHEVAMNPCLGKRLRLKYEGAIHCVECGRKTSKSFNQGFCYPCFKSLAKCDSCIVSPEKCHYAAGTCREPEWGEQHCMMDHYVYLANTSGMKVGITRGTQIPTRWIDQGAIQALPMLRVSSRLQSGLVEVAFKPHVADKTNWRAMLKGSAAEEDLIQVRRDLLDACQPALERLQNEHGLESISVLEESEVTLIEYPVLEHPTKVASFNLDKTPVVEGVLMGIKGQYLMLDSGVINVRKYAGYQLSLQLCE